MDSKKLIKKIQQLQAYAKFGEFLSEMSKSNYKIPVKNVSIAIFYQLFRIRLSQWKYKETFKRGVDYALSDIFQDLIAHYLKLTLGDRYEILIEYQDPKIKCRPDIIIKKDKKYHAAIEVKTTIGWDRGLVKKEEYLKRLKEISNKFNIPLKRCFYVLETPMNVNKEFALIFWNINKNERKEKKGDRIYNFILPLFYGMTSPYYQREKPSDKYRDFKDSEILGMANNNIVTYFDEIVKKIG